MKTTAVILAAGLGTRFLPLTKTINKCMLPLGNKPVIQYAVEECVDAGIDTIVVLVPEYDTSIQEYFTPQQAIEETLTRMGKLDVYRSAVEQAEALGALMQFVTVSYADGRYGTGEMMRQAMEYIADDVTHVALLHGDAPFGYADGRQVGGLSAMMQAMVAQRRDGVLAGFSVELAERSKYGVLMGSPGDSDRLDRIVEKPGPDVSPSSLNANAAWYILPVAVREYLQDLQPDATSGEYLFTDAVSDLAQARNIGIFSVDGVYLDCGKPDVWLAANNYLAKVRSS